MYVLTKVSSLRSVNCNPSQDDFTKKAPRVHIEVLRPELREINIEGAFLATGFTVDPNVSLCVPLRQAASSPLQYDKGIAAADANT